MNIKQAFGKMKINHTSNESLCICSIEFYISRMRIHRLYILSNYGTIIRISIESSQKNEKWREWGDV